VDGRFGSRRIRTFLAVGVVVAVLCSLVATVAAAPGGGAQGEMARHLRDLADLGTNLKASLAVDLKRRLSSGGLELIAIGDNATKLAAGLEGSAALGASQLANAPAAAASDPLAASDPYAAEDFLSRMTGMTQSETTAAWCGSNALIAYNDSGSFAATVFGAVSPSGSVSFNGWARSTDTGVSYKDMGPLLADPVPTSIVTRDLFGDPVLGCTSASTFYYASLALDTAPDGSATTGISVSTSTNGGSTFSRTVLAAGKDGFTHFLDKPWMVVQPGPTNSPADDILHVTYTDFDGSGTSPACPDQTRTAIEYVRSNDGGATWRAPIVIDRVCGDESFVQGSHVAFGAGNDVYVAWERFADFQSRDIRIRRSGTGGNTFAPATIVGAVTPIGDGFVLQGDFRTFLDLQGLVVDKSSGPNRGRVYLTWHDGRNRTRPDPLGNCGGTLTYCFGDALLSRSDDSGMSWSAARRINNDPITLGIDQWFPAIDVDRSGTVWVAFHDRRRDRRNFLIDTFVASSTDGGVTWKNSRLTPSNFAPVTGWEDLVVNPLYMGDYIAVAADSLGGHDGAIVSWGDNSLGDANVLQRRL
jgi:hypothetical protein